MADKKESTELAKATIGLPAFIDKHDNAVGFEGLGIDTMAIPFIKVLNAMSPELDESESRYMAGAKLGDIVNSVTHKNYGKSIDFVVIKFEHIFIEWLPERGGFAGYHQPEEAMALAIDPTKFGTKKASNGNDLDETYMYYMVINGHEEDGVVIFSADSADLKQGKILNTLLLTKRFADGQKALPHHQIITGTTVDMKNDKGKWKALTFTFKEFVDENVYNIVMQERKLLAGKKVDYSLAGGDDTVKTQNKTANIPY